MIRYAESAFVVLLVGVAAYVIVGASGWSLQTRLFPWVVGFPFLGLALAQLVVTLRARPTASAEGPEASAADALAFWNPAARKEAIRLICWIGVFLLSIALLSIPAGLPLGMLLYLKLESGEKWPLTLLLAGVTYAYLYLLFDYGLHIAWPDGIVTGFLSAQFGG